MAFCHRIGKSKLKNACTQTLFRRCYIQLPHASSLYPIPQPRPLEMPHLYWGFHERLTPTCVSHSVRFFAAPVQFQAKQKKEEEYAGEPRLNEEIKAQYVRLVTDDGHSIVSRFEALKRAREHKLDLVEVQRNANPPVCKIMDFHKVMYMRQEREKERAKSKFEVTLRKGESKEVRFSEKTELKDLKMKAEMIKKLMEKGYRVKCRATGNESQDMTGSLSRLLALIEDVSVVESGPHLAKKEAYMIVRHVKYGPAKKGGGKKLLDATHMDVDVKAQEGNMEQITANSSDSIEYENQSSAESWFENDEVISDSDNVDRTISPNNQTSFAPKAVFPAKSNDSVSPAESENRYRRADNPSESKVGSNAQVPPAVTENRYKRAEPRNRFQQTTVNDTGLDNKVAGMRDAVPKHGPSHPSAPNIPRPGGYGIFSAAKGPERQGVKAGMHRNREGNSQDSTRKPFSRESQ